MKSAEIRKKFLSYFESKQHRVLPSSSLMPVGDPTLLFTNAGMNQFKSYFTGAETPEQPRAVTVQKCVRAGGKHNDLENVGHTARHHTFFEMLGNFSFGNYFKEDAIVFAWEFLTKELGIPSDRLYATVHESDDEAFDIWNKKIGLSADRIFRKGDKDNFWEMGEYGPCGPCSEIFYDHGEKYTDPNLDQSKTADILCDEMRYVEVWNLVFMQYEKSPEGTKRLPNPSIDTGAGLERLTAVMQKVYWNYDTDLFLPIIKKIEELSKKSYNDVNYQAAMRVVADHVRSCTMLISDGITPSNEGRGYVLRRIARRAVRYLRELEMPKNSLAALVPTVFEILGESYPQNLQGQSLAEKLLVLEEEKFLETLETGIKYLNAALKNVKDHILSGEVAFKLYDTYGFPIDLTEVIVKEKNISLNYDEFNSCMKARVEDSRKSWKGNIAIDQSELYKIKEQNGETKFVGYESFNCKAKVIALLSIKNKCALIADQTPFYGESGGQTGDIGVVTINSETFNIVDTLKPIDGLHLHLLSDEISFDKAKNLFAEGKEISLSVDHLTRNRTRANHTATHLLHKTLATILGDHVKQSGSHVGPDRLRFDFTHTQAVTTDELLKIEEQVNERIWESLPVSTEIMTPDEATNAGATALFGEKYGEQVRVVSVDDFSCELCGGTHVFNTNEISLFTILLETSLATGIRRIEALTGKAAYTHLKSRSSLLSQIELKTSSNSSLICERVDALYDDLRKSQKEIQKLQDTVSSLKSANLFTDLQELPNGVKYILLNAAADDDLKKLSDQFVTRVKEGVVVMLKDSGSQQSVLVRATKGMEKINCGAILKSLLSECDGKGGGKADMAQGTLSTGKREHFSTRVKEVLSEI